MRELHLTKKDFHLEWFSGTGAGGQHRNKHQNCCRITHIETGLRSISQTERDRPSNQAQAFKRLVAKIIAYYDQLDRPVHERNEEVIRNYHAERNEVLDKASGLRMPYRYVVDKGEIAEMIEARAVAVRGE